MLHDCLMGGLRGGWVLPHQISCEGEVVLMSSPDKADVCHQSRVARGARRLMNSDREIQ